MWYNRLVGIVVFLNPLLSLSVLCLLFFRIYILSSVFHYSLFFFSFHSIFSIFCLWRHDSLDESFMETVELAIRLAHILPFLNSTCEIPMDMLLLCILFNECKIVISAHV